MKRDRSLTAGLDTTFRNSRNQTTMKEVSDVKPPSKLERFEEKYKRLSEEIIAGFNSVDLAFYFKKKSEESGSTYYIANLEKEAAIFKRLAKTYTNLELCLMCEFIFSPEQTYLQNVSPNVLSSAWCNTIYRDSVKWAKGEPITTKRKQKVSREWVSESVDSVKIGEW